LELEGFIYGR
jgi:hypothetical protein